MDIKEIKIDSSKLDHADWVGDLGRDFNGVRVKVRAVENKNWRRLRLKLGNQIPLKRRVDGGNFLPEDQDKIIATCLLEASLEDWEGLTMNGAPLPYSKEMAQKLLTDPDYRKFFDAVLQAASTVAEQTREEAQDIAKN